MTTGQDISDHAPLVPGYPALVDGSIRGLEADRQVFVIALEAIVLLIPWILSLLGNTLVILVVFRSRRVQSTTNFFVISLACSDVILVLLSAPFICVRVVLQAWAPGNFFCRMVRFTQFTSMSSTSFVLVAICIDRYYTIIYPLSFKITRGTAKRMVLTAWGASAVISSLCVYFFDQVDVRTHVNATDKRFVCPTYVPAAHWSGVLYAGLCLTSQYLVPVISVTVGYWKIFFYIRDMRRHQTRCSRLSSSLNIVPRTKEKMVKMLFTVTFLTLLLYLPFYASHVVYCISYKSYLSADVFVSSYWMIAASATTKPIVYAWQNTNFWRGCKEVLCMSTMRCYRLNTYAVTYASAISKRNFVGVMDISLEHRQLGSSSPMEAFNRQKQQELTSWPLHGNLPSSALQS